MDAISKALPPIVDRQTWRAALDELRQREKAATRELDAIAAQRRRLVVTRTIAASPEEIFAVLADPSRHHDTEPPRLSTLAGCAGSRLPGPARWPAEINCQPIAYAIASNHCRRIIFRTCRSEPAPRHTCLSRYRVAAYPLSRLLHYRPLPRRTHMSRVPQCPNIITHWNGTAKHATPQRNTQPFLTDTQTSLRPTHTQRMSLQPAGVARPWDMPAVGELSHRVRGEIAAGHSYSWRHFEERG